jgi:creatinine amidohydrolase
MRPWIIAETTWSTIARTAYDVAVLPWGATEAHNYHLPYGTDTIQAEHIAGEAARVAWEAGARVAVLPAVPFGVQAGQLDIPFCINVNASTQAALLRDVVQSVEGHGIRRVVVLNGHGGNDFRGIIRELQTRGQAFLCVVDWYRMPEARQFFTEPGDHAGELETSVMQHIAPTLVRPLTEAGPGAERRFRMDALREGWAWAPRHWRSVTEDTGVGDPRAATAAKGERCFDAVTTRIGAFLAELAAADIDRLYGD